jgi:SNF2 family DNA or RNA helicase
VGGVGLNLTAASRVVILDPSWTNIDNQAVRARCVHELDVSICVHCQVDRVYRLGQTKNVIIYRLITVGTVEEKVNVRDDRVFTLVITDVSTSDLQAELVEDDN